MNQPAPLKTFIIYSSKDRELREQLESHLRALVDLEWISLWSDKEIAPGERWDKAIKDRLLDTEIFLMLVSVDFYNSGYIREEEFKTALARLDSGDSMVIPIIVRPCDWESYPVIKDLQVLPPGGHAVTDTDHWKDRDKAWHTIAKKLRERIQDLRTEREVALATDLAADLAAEAQRAKEAAQRAKEAEDVKEAKLRQIQQQQLEKERLAALDADLAAEAQRAKEAAQKAQEADAARLRAEQERLRTEQERERQWNEAHDAGWTAASEQHNLNSYQQFLAAYPGSAYAGEARERIKTLQQSDRHPLAWSRWVGIGAGVMIIALVVWKMTLSITENLKTTNQASSVSPPIPEMIIEKIGDINYPMVRVAGGTYSMGSPETEAKRSNDECQHDVAVNSFCIGQTEVTQAQWKAVMKINPSKFRGDNLPVEQVSWNEVQLFIKKLNEKTGKNFRLPMEKEWEYAARGGNRSSGYIYAGSNNLDEVAWYGYSNGTHSVGSKKANELSLYDMSGNVWEWSQDKYGNYPGCSEPKQMEYGYVLRGGYWDVFEGDCRSANRSYREPNDWFDGLGFRLAKD